MIAEAAKGRVQVYDVVVERGGMSDRRGKTVKGGAAGELVLRPAKCGVPRSKGGWWGKLSGRNGFLFAPMHASVHGVPGGDALNRIEVLGVAPAEKVANAGRVLRIVYGAWIGAAGGIKDGLAFFEAMMSMRVPGAEIPSPVPLYAQRWIIRPETVMEDRQGVLVEVGLAVAPVRADVHGPIAPRADWATLRAASEAIGAAAREERLIVDDLVPAPVQE